MLLTSSPKNGQNRFLLHLETTHVLRVVFTGSHVSSDALVQVEPPSPQPSVDRLSVTFAPEERSYCSDSPTTMNVFTQGSPPASNMEKVHFSREPTVTGCRHLSVSYNLSFVSVLRMLCFLLYFRLQLLHSIAF